MRPTRASIVFFESLLPPRKMSRIALCVVLALAVASVFAQVDEMSSARKARWCVPYDQPPAYARLCTRALSVANTDEVEFECVPGGSFREVGHSRRSV